MIEQDERLQLCDAAELISRPPAPWQLRGVLRTQSVVLLYGRRGCYKSFVALDLAASMATGAAWHGHEIATPGLVIYIAAEGGGGMVQRARAWIEQHQLRPSQVDMLFVTEPVLVTADSDDVELLIERIRAAIDWRPAGTEDEENGQVYENPTARQWPVLLVIDTLARCFRGDENKGEDMGLFVQGCDRLKREFNCSILVIHHTGRDESRERGHTALPGACDTIYKLVVNTETHELTLYNEKMKDGREPEPIELLYREVNVSRRPDDDPLEPLTSVIIVDPQQDDSDKTQVLLTALGNQHLTWSQWASLTDLPKATFGRYHMRLRQSGQILKENGKWRKSSLTPK